MAPMAPDRVVTRADMDARVRAHFAQLDTNRDGYVTTEEMSAMRSVRGMHGGDGEGRIEEHVMRGNPAAAFDRIDANHDGSISRDEFAKGREVTVEKRVITRGGAPGAPGLPMRLKMHGGLMGAGLLRMADTDKDGRVSLAEATSGAMQHFDMMDANRDGRLTPEERQAARGKMRQMRNPG
jgi:Ca2+-binding EF-hand superfamily protein